MDEHGVVLILGAAPIGIGLLLLTNDKFVAFVSRTVWQRRDFDAVKADRYFQGWTGVLVGIGLVAYAIFL